MAEREAGDWVFNLNKITRDIIIQCLIYHNGNRTRAAKDLGIAVRTLRNLIVKYTNEGHFVEPAKKHRI